MTQTSSRSGRFITHYFLHRGGVRDTAPYRRKQGREKSRTLRQQRTRRLCRLLEAACSRSHLALAFHQVRLRVLPPQRVPRLASGHYVIVPIPSHLTPPPCDKICRSPLIQPAMSHGPLPSKSEKKPFRRKTFRRLVQI